MAFELVAKIAAPLVTAVVAFLIQKYFQDRPRLITYVVQASAIPMRDEQNTTINTHSIVVRNTGSKTAHNVRIGHHFLPRAYQINPQLQHEILTEGEGHPAEILIPTLVPDEQVNIAYLYFPPVLWSQIHSYCKSDEVTASTVSVVPSPVLTKLQKTTLWSLIFVGASTLVYWLILLVWPLVNKGGT